MCRLLGYCTRSVAPLTSLIGEDGLREFTALAAWHGDGWGMAWTGQGRPTAVQTRTSPRSALDDPEYHALASKPLGELGLVHLRWATPGLPIEPRNSHPFCRSGLAMAHNGAIHPQHRLPELLPPEWERQLVGTTDSERYFLRILSGYPGSRYRGADLGSGDLGSGHLSSGHRGGDLVTAIAGAAADITARFDANSLNAVLLAPDALYAVCWYDPARIPEAELRARGHPGPASEIARYFELAYRQTPDGVLVASSGWQQDPADGWTVLPNRHVLIAERGSLQVRVEPLTARLLPRLCAHLSRFHYATLRVSAV